MPLSWAGVLLTVIWIVLLVNAYNFMDGIDGIAAVQLWRQHGWMMAAAFLELRILSLTRSRVRGLLGFLIHNWAPARIFMGA